jgi:TonB family protein
MGDKRNSPERKVSTLLSLFKYVLLAAVLVGGGGQTKTEDAQCPDGQFYIEGQGCALQPLLVHKVAPKYPKKAGKRHIEGHVIVQALIRRDGHVAKPEVLRAEPQGVGFEQAAIKAVKKWRYKPAQLQSEPVEVYFTVYVNFTK